MSPYRPIPTRDVSATAPAQRPSLGQRVMCALGVHVQRRDYVNQLLFCVACARALRGSVREINDLCDGRLRFEREYLLGLAYYHGTQSGNGRLRWLGSGLPISDELIAERIKEARTAFELARATAEDGAL